VVQGRINLKTRLPLGRGLQRAEASGPILLRTFLAVVGLIVRSERNRRRERDPAFIKRRTAADIGK
jgi:hypothetical protein